jgi:hypothetical protein
LGTLVFVGAFTERAARFTRGICRTLMRSLASAASIAECSEPEASSRSSSIRSGLAASPAGR